MINFGNFGNQFWQSILATLAINFGNLGNWPRKMAIAILPKSIAPLFTDLAQSYVQTQPTPALGLAHYYSVIHS